MSVPGAVVNVAPKVFHITELPEVDALEDHELQALREEVYDIVRGIKDPEHPFTLEELKVVQEAHIDVDKSNGQEKVRIVITPTVPHCTLTTLIGLCIRFKLLSKIPNIKLTLKISPGAHQLEDEIDRQINDKERVCAALEVPSLLQTVEQLTRDTEENY